MLQKVQQRLENHQEMVQDTIDNLQNYIYMLSLLSYETVLRGDRIFVFAQKSAVCNGYRLADVLKQKGLGVYFYTQSDEMRVRLQESLVEGDLFFVLASQEQFLERKLLEIAKERGAKVVVLSAVYNDGAFEGVCDVSVAIKSERQDCVDAMHLVVVNIVIDAILSVLKVA